MSDLNKREYKRFEEIKKAWRDGSEYWSARELAPILEYTEWRNFSRVIAKAMIACDTSGFSLTDHFVEANKMVEIGSGTMRNLKDYELSRYACYLLVQNGDPRKKTVALGQTYFAIQTHRQEMADRLNPLDESKKRLILRGDIKQWNQLLAEAAHAAKVITDEEFATFQNAGYMGLYGGETVENIHSRKELSIKERILDFMGSEELIANLFRISQTESKLKKGNTKGAEDATATHYRVGKEVRAAIKKIGSTLPEQLPTPDKGIPEIEKEVLKKLKDKAKSGQLMLDE